MALCSCFDSGIALSSMNASNIVSKTCRKSLSRSFWQRSKSSHRCPLVHNYSTLPERLPLILRPSFLRSLVPKFMRRKDGNNEEVGGSKPSKGWNPATFYICMFLLIGSNSINLITIRNEYNLFMRKSDAKIAQLKGLIEKVQKGEAVNVERALGTGDDAQEQEWKDVLRELELHDPSLRQDSSRESDRTRGSDDTNKIAKDKPSIGTATSEIAGQGYC